MTSARTPPAGPGLDTVLAALDLTETGVDRFAGDSIRMGLPRVFGGQVLAQALVAAARTTPPAVTAHSLHAHFLRAGDPDRPIDFAVDRLRDGRRLSVRSVTATQGGRALATATLSFAADLDGVEHQLTAPAARPADELPNLPDYAAQFGGLSESWGGLEALDCRLDADRPELVWQRIASTVPDDPVIHQALLVYLSDVTTLAAALVQHGIPIGVEEFGGRTWDGVSLDHALWFHRPVRADDWLLFAQSSPSASRGRALTRADVFDRAGVLVASLAQEGLFLVH
jgi:acyl-CoA thioesterase II